MQNNRVLTNEGTKSYQLLAITALSGEFPATQLSRIGGADYMEVLAHDLKAAHLLRTFYKHKLRGYRLTARAKSLLLSHNPYRYTFYLTGSSETNQLKSEPTRRLRLYRMAEAMVTMQLSGVHIFRDEKPDVFYAEGTQAEKPTIKTPTFYTSREMKELGTDFAKTRGARAVGVLLADDIFVVYNTGSADCKWHYKAEMRTKALLTTFLCRDRLSHQYSDAQLHGLLLGEDMEMAYELLTSPQRGKRDYFIMDGNFDHFYYIPNTHAGEVVLQLLCSSEQRAQLNAMLSQNLSPQDSGSVIENDGISENGLPVLFAYDMDLPRILRFYNALCLQERQGIVICFDFQADVFARFFGTRVSFETINLSKFEGRFNHQK